MSVNDVAITPAIRSVVEHLLAGWVLTGLMNDAAASVDPTSRKASAKSRLETDFRAYMPKAETKTPLMQNINGVGRRIFAVNR